MNRPFKITAISLLCFVSLTALYGGWALMIDPSGDILQMPVAEMHRGPFKNYLVPGAILFFVIGWGNILVLPAVVMEKSKAHMLLILAGMTLCGWIIVQMIMLAQVNWLHAILIAIGTGLIFVGIKARKSK